MERILITGGAGFIGSHLTDELLTPSQHTCTQRPEQLENVLSGDLAGAAII